ncbi:MAG: hypothetical protein KDD83_16145, partial [Caldilineaceae bacterium]|nr:hypothetical protein [Caldilineaceae bacterium]
VVIAESDGSSEVTEGSGGVAGYWVWLASQPTADVTVTVAPDAQVRTDRTQLRFTPSTWKTRQLVRISAVDDDIAEGEHQAQVTHTVASADGQYNDPGVAFVGNGADPRVVHVTVSDNDTAGLAVAPTELAVVEGEIALYNVRLASRAATTVTVAMTSADARLTFLPTRLVFTDADWNRAQTVTVAVADNAAFEGPIATTVQHATRSANPAFDGLTGPTVNVLVIDNDTGGVRITPTDLAVSEDGGDATYAVVLTGAPQAEVRVTPRYDAAQLDLTDAPLLFTPETWSTPQALTVRALDDQIDERGGGVDFTTRISHTVSSTDGAFDAILAPNLVVTIADNDTAGVRLSTSSLALAEGPSGYGSYALMLTSRPREPVTVTVTTDDVLALTPTTLVFTPDNWDAPQEIAVRVVDDEVDWSTGGASHAHAIDHLVHSDDPAYDDLAVDTLTVAVRDNDSAGVTVTPRSTRVSEDGQSATYQVGLTSMPHAPVQIWALPDAQVTTVPSRIVFTPENWTQPVQVTVRALDDARDESTAPYRHAGRVTHRLVSADAGYAVVAVADVAVEIEDNDDAGLVLSSRRLTLAEKGAAGTDLASFSATLAAALAAPVTVRVIADAQVTVVGDDALTFDASNWNVPQLVVLRAVDDDVAEGLHQASVQLQYPSAAGAAIRVATVDVTVADDDAAAVFVTPLELVAQTGASATPAELYYAVRVTTAPTDTVTITAAAPAGVRLNGAAQALLTFDAANWQAAQTVVVELDPELLQFGPPVLVVAHTVASADPAYAAQTAPAVMVVAQAVFMQGDPDADGLATGDEDLNGDGDPTNDDTDRDGTANYLDDDDDGDGVLTVVEGTGDDDGDG